MPSRIEFRTIDGVTLRGDFYQAAGIGRPIVVMTAGLTLLKEHMLPAFAARFRAAGISSLAYDYRTWGSSDGTPRQDVNLLQQADDYRDAVTAAMALPGVDPNKVIVMGLGHGAAAALISIADDPRPKAAILQSPIISGRRDEGLFPKGWVEKAWRDRESKARTGDLTPTYVKTWPDSPDEGKENDQLFINNEMAYGLISESLAASNAAATPWDNKVTLRSVLSVVGTEAGDFIHKIAQPTLYVVFPADPFTGTAQFHRTAFDKMGSNGEFKVVNSDAEGSVESFIVSTADVQIEFIKRICDSQ